MTQILLGNPNPQMQVDVPQIEDGEVVGTTRISVNAKHLTVSETVVDMWDGFDDSDFVDLTLSTDNDRTLAMIARLLGPEHRLYAVGINELEQIMGIHSAGVAPTWVSCPDDPGFEAAAAEWFRCARGRPEMLLTSVGRDMLHQQHLSTSAQPASCNFMAISANATAPSTASTTLPGEITTAGGGLLRAQGTFAHTVGTNTSTLSHTWTANGSDSLPVVVAKLGILNASSVGTLGYETLLNATATLTISGDSLTATDTVTAG